MVYLVNLLEVCFHDHPNLLDGCIDAFQLHTTHRVHMNDQGVLFSSVG